MWAHNIWNSVPCFFSIFPPKSLLWGGGETIFWVAAQSFTHLRRASTVLLVGFVSWCRYRRPTGFRKCMGASKATNCRKSLRKGLWQMLLNFIGLWLVFFTMCFLVVLLPVTWWNTSHVIVRAIISMLLQNSCYPRGAPLEPEMLLRDEFPSKAFGFSYLPLGFAVWYLLIRSLYWSVAQISMRPQLMLPVKKCDFVTACVNPVILGSNEYLMGFLPPIAL